MTDSFNLVNSSELNNESKLKEAFLYLTNEYNNLKKDRLNPLYEELKLTKNKFHSYIKEYQKEVELNLEKEKEIEQLFSKISKIKKKKSLIMNISFNDKFYNHLVEISENPKKEKILKNFFSLVFLNKTKDEKSINDLIQMLKDKEEIKSFLHYVEKIYSDMRTNDEESFFHLKKKFEKCFFDIDELDRRQYPFDELFECLNIIFEIIELEKKIKDNNKILEKLTEKKNAKFVEIKIMEVKIKNINKNIKLIQNNLKFIRTISDKFNEQKDVYTSEQGLKELLEKIEEYKKIEKEYQKMAAPFDVITSLTFGTYYTISEDSSVKSSRLSSKNGLNLFNNNMAKNNKNNNLDTNKNKISQMNTYETVFKTFSNCNSNHETNDKDIKRNINKKQNQEKNNYTVNKNQEKKININKNKNKTISNDNSKDNINLKQKEIYIIKNNNKTFDAKYMENIKKNKIIKLENKISSNKTLTKQKEKTINCLKQITNKNKLKPEEKKVQTPNYENNKNSYYNIKEENEKANIKAPYNFTDLNNLGSRMNQLKHREPDESIEILMPKENNNKLDIMNNDNLFNENSICDEMASSNCNIIKNNIRNNTNDYINKIGVKNNYVVSKELYKNKIFMRRNNNNGKLQIEKSIEASTCCVSCT